jgi:branched-chain amino acid transport system permease protein
MGRNSFHLVVEDQTRSTMQFLISAIVLSSVYALLAAGFVIIRKSSRVLNFGYASIAMLLGYLTVTMINLVPAPPFVSIALTLILSFIFGLALYGLLIRPMVGQPFFSTMILTVALGIVLDAITTLIWRGNMETISFGWQSYFPLLGGGRISSTEMISLSTTIVLFMFIFGFYRFTKIGQQMRATTENTLLAAQRGINIYLLTALAWGISIFVTGTGAVVLGSNYSVSLTMGVLATKAFAVTVLGGLDSLNGTIPAAMIIAFVEMATNYYVSPKLADAMPFIIMLIVLLARPWGLFGTKEEIPRV